MFQSIINFFYPSINEVDNSKPVSKKKIKKQKTPLKKNNSNLPDTLLEDIKEQKKNLRKVEPKPAYIANDPFTTFLHKLRKKINGEEDDD